MSDLFKQLEKKRISLPDDIFVLLGSCNSYKTFDTVKHLASTAVGGDNSSYEVKYNIPGRGEFTEAIVHKVTNGISVNYTESYMRS